LPSVREPSKPSFTSLPFTNKVVTSYANPDYKEIHSLVRAALRSSKAKPDPTASASTSPTEKPRPNPSATKAVKDPTKAQDVRDVC